MLGKRKERCMFKIKSSLILNGLQSSQHMTEKNRKESTYNNYAYDSQ